MLSRRSFLRQVGGFTALGAAWPVVGGVAAGAARKKLPNIVLVFTDDQGYGDLGCFGAEGYRTPHIDRMAREGMRFTDFHVSTAVCSASRAALMTGCYNKRVSVFGALFPGHDVGLNPAEETIAEVLRGRGYTTGIFGKWHLGHHHKFLPLQQGFDEYFGVPYSHDMWKTHYDGKPLSVSSEGSPQWKLDTVPLPLMEGNTITDHIRTLEDVSSLTRMLTDRAVSFIERNRHRPFFLYVPHPLPHVPLGASDEFRGSSEQGMYGDVIQEIDHSVGRIVEALERNGLTEDTLVVFTTDNGPWLSYGNHGGSAGPLRESKGTMWEGGCRVPCVMRWPGVIPAGRTCDKLASTIDLLPTFAELAGAELPEKPIDGVSIVELLKGRAGAEPRKEFWFYWDHNLIAVRQGKWKLVFPHRYTSFEGVERGRDGWPKPSVVRDAEKGLYDMEKDLGERNNLIEQHPEIVARLEEVAERARTELGDRLTQRTGRGIRPIGRL